MSISPVQEHDALLKHLSIDILEVSEGYARAEMPLQDTLRNGVGLAHGGAIFALADIAFAAAANTQEDVLILNAQSSISFVKAGKTGPLTAEAKRVTQGSRVAVYDVEVHDAEGSLLAMCRITGYRTTRS